MKKHDKFRDDEPLRRGEKDLLWVKINHTLGKRKRLIWIRWASAAAAVLIIGGGVFFLLTFKGKSDRTANIFQVARISGKLLQGNKEISILEYGQSVRKVSNSLYFGQDNQSSNGYKTLFVPYGRRQDVILADGTKIWLNSGSYLTFPSNFSGKDREVYLNGEAFFDVAHNIKPFKVLTRENTIRVLGTSFNVSSYEDDAKMVTGLISGSISLENNNQLFHPLHLKPGEELSVEFGDHTPKLTKSLTMDGILWTKRQLALNRTPMPELIKKLERIYNVSIHFSSGTDQATTSYLGRIDLNMPVDEVLKNIYELEGYHIELKNKEVMINK
ncbi:FecR family protein [bacterium A37T11]|nr:FecR family protein [bacterium A37T11]